VTPPIIEVLPAEPTEAPPVVLVHGAANSASVWTYWQQQLADAGIASYAAGLRGHDPGDATTDLGGTSMHDYADDVRAASAALNERPVVMGWSMGGLIAMMVAATGEASACVGLAPSTPARRIEDSVEIRRGEYDATEYGITSHDPADQPAMPDLDIDEREIALASLCRESRRASDERKAGIVIESLPCPLLIVTGGQDRQWSRSRYDGLWLDADYAEVEGASHWGLVLSRRALDPLVPRLCDWIRKLD